MRFSTTTTPNNLYKKTAMVFSSVPAYLDPSTWQQHHHPQHVNHHIIGSAAANPLPPPPQPHGAPGSGPIRPGSMSERARQANIPLPESALKCPRCDSINTKFCYFNNYSLTQPRHFCKTCRRYWTRGGALRSVPVGGGCRRNKRSSKSTSSSKSSPASSDGNREKPNPGLSTTSGANTSTIPTGYGGGLFQPLRFMSPLSQLSEGFAGEMSMGGFGGNNIQPPPTSEYLQMGGFQGAGNMLGFEQWKMQQFPFLGGLDPSPGNYQFHSGGESGFLGGELRPKISSSLLSQLASVKMEESKNSAGLSLMSRELLGGMQGNEEQWNINGGGGGGGWTELSSFSSSTSNHLQ